MAIGAGATQIASATGLTGLDATSTLSIALWYRCPIIMGNDIFSHDNATGFADGYLLWRGSAGSFVLRTLNGSTATDYTSPSFVGMGVCSTGFHLAVSMDGSAVRWFIKGIQVARHAQTANMTVAGTRSTQVASIGGQAAQPCEIYDLRVWNDYALKNADAAYVARGGVLGNEKARWFVGSSKAQDLTGNGNLLTLNAGARVVSDPDLNTLINTRRRTVLSRATPVAISEDNYSFPMQVTAQKRVVTVFA